MKMFFGSAVCLFVFGSQAFSEELGVDSSPSSKSVSADVGTPLTGLPADFVVRYLSAGLLNPAAAKFSELTTASDGRFRYVCGKVNALNSHGAYLGDTVFFGHLTFLPPTYELLSWGRGPEARLSTFEDCERHGMFLHRPLYWLQD
tara:strand:- start:1443 stop:1880 length:438 start_codon:yes stop_codon:yes gene_type:complete